MLACLLICSSERSHAAIDGQEPAPRPSTTPALQKERPVSPLLHRGRQAFTQFFAGKPDRQGWAIVMGLVVSIGIVGKKNMPALLRELICMLNGPGYVFLGILVNMLIPTCPGMHQDDNASQQYSKSPIGVIHNIALLILFIVLCKLCYTALYKASLQDRIGWLTGCSFVSWCRWYNQTALVAYKKSSWGAICMLMCEILCIVLCKLCCDALCWAGRKIASHIPNRFIPLPAAEKPADSPATQVRT